LECTEDLSNVELLCDTLTSCESTCEDEVDLTQIADVAEFVCGLVDTEIPALPEIPTEIPSCVAGCVDQLAVDPTLLCEGFTDFNSCVTNECTDLPFSLLTEQLQTLACLVEPPACAIDCALEVADVPNSADAVCSSLTDTSACLSGDANGCGDDDTIFVFLFETATDFACQIMLTSRSRCQPVLSIASNLRT